MHLVVEDLVEFGLEAGAVDDFTILLHDALVLLSRVLIILIKLREELMSRGELLRVHISQFSRLSLDLLLVLEELVQTKIGFDLSIPVDIVCELLTL